MADTERTMTQEDYQRYMDQHFERLHTIDVQTREQDLAWKAYWATQILGKTL